MRILFAGTPEIAVPSLIALSAEHTICAVLTNPDRESGRGRRVAASPVAAAAHELELTVLQPERLDGAARDAVAALRPELLVVVAYGRIFGPKFLALFPKGGINLHPSLLPKYRGPSPITAAILAGDRETGITVQRLALEMDAGDILGQIRFAIGERETTATLTERAAREGAELLVHVCRELDRIRPVPQDPDAASYCRLVTREDALIDWTRSAVEIDRVVRAYDPWPRARTSWKGGELLVHAAASHGTPGAAVPQPGAPQTPSRPAPGSVVGVDTERGILVQTGSGILAIQMLQLPSKKPLHWKAFLNGVHDFVGATLGGRV